MKKLLLLLPLFFVLHSFGQTTYYVDSATGVDGAGVSGSSSTPWKTLYYATTRVSTSGSIIHVNKGTYVEPNQMFVSVGVSLEGQDTINTHIKLNYCSAGGSASTAAIMFQSTTEGTNGNQYIKNMWFDVKDSVKMMILFRERKNITVHDCKFTNAWSTALGFIGQITTGAPPTVFSTNNQIYNCSFTNNSDRSKSGGLGGAIGITGQDSMYIHDNIIHQDQRPLNHNGDCIGAVQGWNKGINFYNNKFYKPLTDSAYSGQIGFNCAIESWNAEGGWHIYNNIFYGGGGVIDVAFQGRKSGVYNYSFNIVNNQFLAPAQEATLSNTYGTASIGINWENQDDTLAGYAFIDSNTFVNFAVAFQITMSHGAAPPTKDSTAERVQNIHFHHNLIENAGYGDGGFGGFMVNLTINDGNPNNEIEIDSIYVDNNTMISGSGGTGSAHARAGLYLGAFNSRMRHIYYRNNIIDSTASYGALTVDGTSSGSIDSLFYQNNVAFKNQNLTYNRSNSGSSNITAGPQVVTHYTNSGTITTNPLLDGTYHLQSGSPAIDAGLNIGYAYNGSAPDIGAFETTPPGHFGVTRNNVISTENSLNVRVLSNPSVNYFTIITSSSSDVPLNITVTDILGRKLESSSNVSANGSFQLGSRLNHGIYFVEVMQGSKKNIVKLVKE